MSATINSSRTVAYTNFELFDGSNDRKFTTMRNLLASGVQAYVERNKVPPAEIFCFHSAVPADQMNLFVELFIKPSKGTFENTYKDQKVNFTMVLINGKTSERFFSPGGQISNVPAGTLIAKDVVSKDYDFFIVSQRANKGTSVPNHYKVIYSDSKVEEGFLQEIIFAQCFGYFNWTGSIKVPAVLQYAKKAAKFGAEVIENNSVPHSLHRLYYFI